MKSWLLKQLLILSCAGGVLLATGCGGESNEVPCVKVQGKLVVNNVPLKVGTTEDVQVSFSTPKPAGSGAIGSAGRVNPEDGTFTILGTTGEGIPAGTYQVIVTSQFYGGNGTDRFARVFGYGRYPLKIQVDPGEEQSFLIDLGRRTTRKL